MIKYLTLLLFISTHTLAGTTILPVTAIIPAYNQLISLNTLLEGTEVLIGYDRFQSPCFEALPNFEGDTEYIEIDANNHIEITVSGVGHSPCLGFPSSYGQFQKYSLGELPVGDYSIQMYLADNGTPLPVPPNYNTLQYGLTINFQILAPVVVSSLNVISVFILLSIILLLTGLFYGKFSKLMPFSLLFCLFISLDALAKDYLIELSADVSAPTPDQVMGQSNTSPAPPVWLLNSFNIQAPQAVEYLLLPRPLSTGNLQNLLNNHPNWSLARLYQNLIVRYADNIDENTILSNFASDLHIVRAEVVNNDDMVVSASLNKVDISTAKNPLNTLNNNPEIPQVNNDYLTDLNINSAWELSEGMGYIAALDLGLQLDHPDLETFDNFGNYLGGNLLGEYYQIDYGLVSYDRVDLNVDAAEPTDTCWQTGTLPSGNPICSNPYRFNL